MKKILLRISSIMCVMLIAVSIIGLNKEKVSTPVRDVELVEQNVDYQALISGFDEAVITYNEDSGYITFEGYNTIKQSDFKSIDFVSLTSDNEDNLTIKYNFEYLENINLFILGIEVENVDGGVILDKIEGVHI